VKLTCPACGAVASAETWAAEVAARAALPGDMADVVLAYLALFRPAKNGLSWSRARKVLATLDEIIRRGHISVDRKPARPCPPAIWAEGLLAVRERFEAGALTTPLKNHNYLRAVVYDLAERADAKNETEREHQRRAGIHRPRPEALPESARAELARLGLGKGGSGFAAKNEGSPT